jgi:uncharacterized protein YwgA
MTEEVSDSEKILGLIVEAELDGITIDEQYLDSYVYLMRERQNIPFGYTFIFHPLPYSDQLREDVVGLKMAGYIISGSIKSTQKGKKYVDDKQAVLSEFKELLEKIKIFLSEFSSSKYFDRRSIFNAVYARIA